MPWLVSLPPPVDICRTISTYSREEAHAGRSGVCVCECEWDEARAAHLMRQGAKLSFRLADEDFSRALISTPMPRSTALPATPMVALSHGAFVSVRDRAKCVSPSAETSASRLTFNLGMSSSTTTTSPSTLPACSACLKPCVFSATEALPFPAKPLPARQRRTVANTEGRRPKKQPDLDFDFPPRHNNDGIGTEVCGDVDKEGRVMGGDFDQYHVPDDGSGLYLLQLVRAVMCKGCCQPQPHRLPGQKFNYVVGLNGHIERLSAWSHLFGFIAFAIYAAVRHACFYRSTTSFAWGTGAAAATAGTFLSSVVYHVTSPSIKISMLTRQLDFVAIYVSIAVCSVADLAAVTRGFINVPIVAIIDVPIAASVLALFFGFRRYELSCDDTLKEEYTGCTFGVGLIRRWHADGEHTPLRQTGSFAIAVFYFTITPAVVESSLNTGLLLGLQVCALVVVTSGMVLDNIGRWPDAIWHTSPRGVPWTSFPRLGCMIDAHGLWHIVALVGAVLSAVAREYAIFSI